ncbi:MAG: glycosyltransferase [Bowdeniella nasicola]|nr:glycosyltransferase [Bowdeniella nasicola]
MSPTILQRVVFADDRDPDLLPLYAEGEHPGRVKDARRERDVEVLREPDRQQASQVLSRRSYRVPAGSRTSFATYMNAFPAAYWAVHTEVRSIRLSVTASGVGQILVSRSNARGHGFRIDAAEVSGEGSQTLTFDLPLDTFGDGGWYWFDAVSGASDLTIESAHWETDERIERAGGRASIAITTFNRTEDCVTVLEQLAASDLLGDYVNEIVVVDQGTQKVSDHPRFDAVAGRLGSQLRVVSQGNLGGSGGFSRGMIEASARGSEYVLLLDDDVRVEPEGIYRGVTFANATSTPTIVGGHMFSMFEPTTLHAFAESVSGADFWWGPTEGTESEHDFSQRSLRATPWLHQRAEAGYNGWWMCLIPTTVVREIGLSLPLFIKWDDAEYGLRAAEAGYPTVTLPGMALWHVPWKAKDDSLDWQAYFHERNRLIAALLHAPGGAGFIGQSFAGQVKHAVSAQYSVVELRDRAILDVLEGPERLHESLETTVPRIREIRSGFDDARVKPDRADFPKAEATLSGTTVKRRAKGPLPYRALIAANALRKQLRRPRKDAAHTPQVHIAFPAARWWTIAQYDSALVSNSDGSGVSFYRRDRDLFFRQLSRTVRLHRALAEQWEDLAARYRAALAGLTSMDAWGQTIGLDARIVHAAKDPDGARARQGS